MALPLRETTEGGVDFSTGQAVFIPFIRNTEKSPHAGRTYQQDIEPHGKYLLHHSGSGDVPPNWVQGNQLLESPLVIALNTGNGRIYDENSWKAHLQRHYGKKGKALSRAIYKDGYDSIVTVDSDGYTSEIVLVGPHV